MLHSASQFGIWTDGKWRCDYWLSAGRRQLRLYHDNQVERTHILQPGESPTAMAHAWQQLVLGNNRVPDSAASSANGPSERA